MSEQAIPSSGDSASPEAAECAREAARYARTRAGEVVESVASYTREHPLAALGMAFAAGVLVASLTRR